MKGIAFFILLMASSGALLSVVNNLTREKIEINNNNAKSAKLLEFVESTDPATLCQKDAVLVQVSEKGYGGTIHLAILFKSGHLNGVRTIAHKETPGFDRILKPENWIGQFGATTSIDAVTGATITSKAVLRGIKLAEKGPPTCQKESKK